MIARRFDPFAVLAVLALAAGLLAPAAPLAQAALRTTQVLIAGHALKVEVAADDARRAKGLMHREKMGRLPGVVKISSSFVLRSVPTRSEADALFGGSG